MMFTLLICLLAVSLLLILTHVWRHRRLFYLAHQMPTVGWSFSLSISLLMLLKGLDQMFEYFLTTYLEHCKRGNIIYNFWLGSTFCVLPTEPDFVHHVLTSVLHKSPCYQIMSGPSGQGLIQHMHLPRWRRHRKVVGTSFQFSLLKSYCPTFFEEATILANKMAPLAISKEPFEPHHLVGLAALNALMRSSFGVDFEIQQNYHSHHPYLESVESSFKIFLVRVFKPWLMINFFSKMCGYHAKLRQNRIIQKEFTESILTAVKKKIDKENKMEIVDENGNVSKISKTPRESKNRDNIISDLLDAQDKFETFVDRVLRDIPKKNPDLFINEKELLHEMVSLLNAGFDTVMLTTSIVLNILALHPQLQEDVFHEIENILGDSDTAPTYEQLQDLNILTRVIKEAMRLYPAAPIIARSSSTELKCGDYTIPAGSTIIIFIYGIHRDPRYWPDPERFDPDRFLPSEVAKRNPNAYLPFSLGARNCIGSKYAMLHMKSTISTLLKRYRILPGAKCRSMRDIRLEVGMTMHPLPGNDIRLEMRRSNSSSEV